MAAKELALHDRVAKLEAGYEAVLNYLDEFRKEVREDFRDIKQDIRNMNIRIDSWLKWVLGFVFSSWLTLMVSIWVQR